MQPIGGTVAARAVLDERWGSVFGANPTAWPGAPTVMTRAQAEAHFARTNVAATAQHASLGTVAVMMDLPFALALASRALGASEIEGRRDGASRSFGAAHEGALALLVAQACAIACAPSPPPIVRGVTDRAVDAIAAIGASSLAVWPWRVAVGVDAGHVALVVDERALASQPPVPSTLEALRFGDLWVTIELRIARATLAAADVAAIAIGDVVLTDHDAEMLTQGSAVASVSLALGAVEVPARWTGDAIAIEGLPRIVTKNERGSDEMSNGKDDTGPGDGASMRTDVLAAIPVDVDVVVARSSATIADVNAWRPGEVVAFPVRIGELVEVRAGGRIVARGELCNVEGQLGVRVTELL